MSKTVLAELVTKMTVESSQFKKELEKTTAQTARFAKEQRNAANDADAGSKKMSQAFRRAANSASTLSGPMGGISSRLSTIATGMSAVGVGGVALGLAIGGLAMIVGSSVSAFSRLEKGLLRTEALFKATGGASGKTAEELEQLTRSVALSTLASVDGVRQAVNVLQTFKSVQGDTFDRTVKLSQDLAAVMGTDIKNSALQLGKALEDPITGLNSLRRSGVSFSQSQKDVIKNLVDTGQTAQAQILILNTLEQQVGGAGSAEAGGLAGATDTLSQRWQELLEGFSQTSGAGDAVTYTLNRIARGMHNVTESFFAAESRGEKLSRLFKEYGELNQMTGFDGKVNPWVKERQAEIKAEIKALNDKTMQESDIFKKGALARKQADAEAKAAELKSQQELSSKKFKALDKSMASEQELIMLRWQERLDTIESLNLSEQEVVSQGFNSLQELKDYHIALNNEKADQEFQKIKERNDKIVQAEKAKQDSINKLNQRNFDNLVNSLAAENNPAELARQQLEARLDVIREYYKLESAEAAKATQAGIAAVESYKKAISGDDLFTTLSDSLNGLSDQVSGTLAQVAIGMADGEEAAQALARTIVTQLTGAIINYGIEQVIAYGTGALAATAAETTKTAAVTTGLAVQTSAAVGATAALTGAAVASGATITAAMAPAAAATSVATAGAAPAAAAPIALSTIGAIIAALVGGVAIAGARELGGPVSGGKTYLVGEKGPELFTANTSGQITSNKNLKKAVEGDSGNIQMTFSPIFNGSNPDEIIPQLKRNQKQFARLVQSVINTPI